jgi:hypothetical protein
MPLDCPDNVRTDTVFYFVSPPRSIELVPGKKQGLERDFHEKTLLESVGMTTCRIGPCSKVLGKRLGKPSYKSQTRRGGKGLQQTLKSGGRASDRA